MTDARAEMRSGWARILGQGFYTPCGAPEIAPLDERHALAPSLALLPRTLRRGLSGLTRSVLAASEGALAELPAGAALPAVFGSRYGEIQTAVELIRRANEIGESSPARFRHSVQNTCLGLLSLAREDTAPNTALSAGASTLAMAMLEAFMQLADGAEHVLVVVAEEPVPEKLGAKPIGGGGAVAWLLAHGGTGGEDALWLSRPELRPVDGPPDAVQPLAGAFGLARQVMAKQPGPAALGGPAGHRWACDLAAGTRPPETP